MPQSLKITETQELQYDGDDTSGELEFKTRAYWYLSSQYNRRPLPDLDDVSAGSVLTTLSQITQVTGSHRHLFWRATYLSDEVIAHGRWKPRTKQPDTIPENVSPLPK